MSNSLLLIAQILSNIQIVWHIYLVVQYLEENVHKTYVDVSDMARVLQERYRAEYGRRKMAPFRQLVEQAYKTVLHSYGLDSNPSSDENEESDLEFMDVSVCWVDFVNVLSSANISLVCSFWDCCVLYCEKLGISV